jgi:acyl carrier protein
VEPRNEVERAIAGLWGELLGIAEIGVADDFFELGGHSVLALQMTSRLRDLFGIDLPLNVLFDAPTTAGLAEVVLSRLGEAAESMDLDAALADLEQLSDDEVRALLAGQQQTRE